MPNGGGHFEEVGLCPHCGSGRIRIRHRVHAFLPWRCRRCNRVFWSPQIGTIDAKWGTKGFVLADSISWRERRSRRKRRRILAARARRKFRRILAAIAVLSFVGIAAWVGIKEYGLPTARSTPDGATQEDSVPVGLDRDENENDEEGGGDDLSLTPVATPALLATLAPAQARTSTPVPASASFPAPTPTLTPLPISTSFPYPTATLTSVPSPTPIPTPTPVVNPSQRHLDEKLYMLELVNNERVMAERSPLVLGDNVAAQLHAEAALAGCYSSHWGDDGLKPYMRYSLAGGYQSNGENGSGFDYCIKASDGYAAIPSIEAEIREAVEGWMDSPGHRSNILDPWHRKLNMGIAWDRYNAPMFAHFEGDYVSYEQLPTIESGILSIEGRTTNGATQQDLWDMAVTIFYDPPPAALTRGQLARTYCYDNGRKVAGLRPPAGGGSYSRHSFNSTYHPCPNPHNVAANTPAPRSPAEASRFWREAYQASNAIPVQSITVPWITSQRWQVNGDNFRIRADISDVLAEHGAGVYSLFIWGIIDSEDVVLSQYSIFWDVIPPDTYSGQ